MRRLACHILHELDARGSLDLRELAATTGSHPVTVERTCIALSKRGDIRVRGGRFYSLTEQGRRRFVALEEQ